MGESGYWHLKNHVLEKALFGVTAWVLILISAALCSAPVYAQTAEKPGSTLYTQETTTGSSLPPKEKPTIQAAADSPGVISAVNWASGVYYAPEAVQSTATIRNTTAQNRTFWLQYSVQDNAGVWRDMDATSVSVPGSTARSQARAWRVPNTPGLTTGSYNLRFSLWNADPDTNAAARQLAVSEKPDAVQVFQFIDHMDSFDTARWTAEGWPWMGCSAYDQNGDCVKRTTYLDPGNVGVNGAGQMQLTLPSAYSNNPEAVLDGGQLRSTSLGYRYGSYTARMKLPNAPSSLTGFFLYGGSDYDDEIDIEIFNNGDNYSGPDSTRNRNIWFTTYDDHCERDTNGECVVGPDGNPVRAAVPTHHEERTLPFDPTSGYHNYRFDFYPGSVSFYVDGVHYQTFADDPASTEDGLAMEPMQLIVNSWYPSWMSQTPPGSDRSLDIEWIRR